jgi:diguanylate cyclase (GGDEF)-like protein
MSALDLIPDPDPSRSQETTRELPNGDIAAYAAEIARLNLVVRTLSRQLAEARVDRLTGLPDREGWIAHATTLLRDPTDAFVLLLDLCGFKTVNDTHGHLVGDALLRTQAARLRQWCEQLAGYGIVGRFGGDEFLAAFRLYDPAALDRELCALNDYLAQPAEQDGIWLQAPAVIGVAQAAAGRPLRALLQTADLAMYQAKHDGCPWKKVSAHERRIRDRAAC